MVVGRGVDGTVVGADGELPVEVGGGRLDDFGAGLAADQLDVLGDGAAVVLAPGVLPVFGGGGGGVVRVSLTGEVGRGVHKEGGIDLGQIWYGKFFWRCEITLEN